MKKTIIFLLISLVVFEINGFIFEYAISRDMPEIISAAGIIALIAIDILYLRYIVKLIMDILH